MIVGSRACCARPDDRTRSAPRRRPHRAAQRRSRDRRPTTPRLDARPTASPMRSRIRRRNSRPTRARGGARDRRACDALARVAATAALDRQVRRVAGRRRRRSSAMRSRRAPGRTPRNAPSRSAPLALMLRRDAAGCAPRPRSAQAEPPPLGAARSRGPRSPRDRTARRSSPISSPRSTARPTQIEDALWELVGAGLATADGFASLRVLVDRRRGEVKSPSIAHGATTATPPGAQVAGGDPASARTRDRERPGHALRSLPTAAGRWSLLPPTATRDALDAEASRAPAARPLRRRVPRLARARVEPAAVARPARRAAPARGARRDPRRPVRHRLRRRAVRAARGARRAARRARRPARSPRSAGSPRPIR